MLYGAIGVKGLNMCMVQISSHSNVYVLLQVSQIFYLHWENDTIIK